MQLLAASRPVHHQTVVPYSTRHDMQVLQKATRAQIVSVVLACRYSRTLCTP